MDLEKVSRKLADGAYRSREDFKLDITKIFDNARVYNQEETIYYKYANQLQAFVKPMLERLKEPALDPVTGEPLFLSEIMSGIHTRRSRAAVLGTGGAADAEMADEEQQQ